ncbi:FliM/FliN family flagellar motor switch protein [Gallaecimonas kandeliae]|uniref:FliM/FliN family flagellar motor switch protein n=1 Tax=Gallaecimonas kandeliae TaxID=3029055 RepID=UPI0026478C3B|nr:FliM/FliN family flagellar motor switch protein [Gallaecimonas kandeliae]WKE66513.1 FliM/FliN family flagellar motor switch protein [Gallaecimonas kandeliae]
MQNKPLDGQGKRFISGARAAEYPSFDLLGERRQAALLRGRLTALNPQLADQLSTHCRHLFNDNNIQVSLSPWQPQGATADYWLGVFGGEGQGVFLGFGSRALFGLSELFFGGQPAAMASKALSSRTLSDTEERLAQKLFHYLLSALFPALGLNLDGWQSRWSNRGPGEGMACCELTLAAGDWQLSWHCCWPQSLGADKPQALPAPQLQAQLDEAVRAVPVKLTLELAQLSLNLGELARLRVGDILPIELNETVLARAGDVVCLGGQVAEQGEQLVLKVTDRVGDVA